MSLHTGQEVREVPWWEPDMWYRTPRGVVFRVLEQPKAVYQRELVVGPVELEDGTPTVLAWGPATRPLSGKQKFFERAARWLLSWKPS